MIEDEFAHGSYGVNAEKVSATYVHDAVVVQPAMEPPMLVRAMSPEQRQAAEKKLVRKIDFRLLPMLILMYIMNYLGQLLSREPFTPQQQLTCFRPQQHCRR